MDIKQESVTKDDVDGLKIIISMSRDDLEMLLSRIGTQCPADDFKTAKVRGQGVDWEKVSFSSYGPRQCRVAWSYLQTRTRKFRIMHELLEEVKLSFNADYKKFMKKNLETSPNYPKQPYAGGAFQFFCKEQWDAYKEKQTKLNKKVDNFLSFQSECHQKWQELSKVKQQTYDEKAKLLAADHKRQVKEFYMQYPGFLPITEKLNKDGNPEKHKKISQKEIRDALKLSQEIYKDAPQYPLSPLQLFMNSKLNRLDPPPTAEELPELKAHYFDKWKVLSNKKRLKWVQSCIKKCEKYSSDIREYKKTHTLFLLPKVLKISNLISRDDFLIWAEANGKPPPPKSNSFELYLEDFKQTDEAIGTEDDIAVVAHKKWQQLDKKRSDLYRMNIKIQNLKFKQEFEEFYNNLPAMLKEIAVETLPKKFRTTFLEEIEKEPLVLCDEETEIVQQGGTKRKKDEGVDDGELNDQDGEKKKKKKRKSKDNEGSQCDEQEELPLYVGELTDDHKKLLEKTMKESRVEPKVEETQSYAWRTYYPGKPITPIMVSHAVRGILDARPCLGRYFTAYYYYAKHVARSESWRNMCTKFGCVYTAGRMVESFHRLSKRQQKLFVKKSLEYHNHRYYGVDAIKYSEIGKPSKTFYFGNEPTPPPRHAYQLYEKEMEGNGNVTPWESLDEETQILYVKKLYKLTKYYITQYESFVKNMVPSEMIHYLIEKSRTSYDQPSLAYREKYENIHQKFKIAESLPLARATYALEMSNDEQDSEPELYDPSDRFFNANVTDSYRFKNNPFSVKRPGQVKKNTLVKILRKKKKQEILKEGEKVDSDLPSSDDEDDYKGPALTVNAALKRKQRLEKLRDLQRFNYPLQDYKNMETGSVARSEISDERRLLGERLMQRHPLVTGILDHIMDVLHSRTPESEELKKLACATFKSVRNVEPRSLAKQKSRKGTKTKKPPPKRAPRKTTVKQKKASLKKIRYISKTQSSNVSNIKEMEPQQSKDESSPEYEDSDEVRREPPIPSFALVTSSPTKSVQKQKSTPSKRKSKFQDSQVDPPYLGETNEQSQDSIADGLEDTEISQCAPSGTVEFDVDDAFYGTQDFFSMEEFNEAQSASHEYFM